MNRATIESRSAAITCRGSAAASFSTHLSSGRGVLECRMGDYRRTFDAKKRDAGFAGTV
jgi:hypothetical protein